VSRRRQGAVVSRSYDPAPDQCVRALELLLRKPVSKEAAEPSPEPDGRKDGTKAKGDSACVRILPETP
jgi:hypothetical protein